MYRAFNGVHFCVETQQKHFVIYISFYRWNSNKGWHFVISTWLLNLFSCVFIYVFVIVCVCVKTDICLTLSPSFLSVHFIRIELCIRKKNQYYCRTIKTKLHPFHKQIVIYSLSTVRVIVVKPTPRA